MKNKLKGFISILFVVLLIFGTIPLSVFAENNNSEYVESHYQFDMDSISLSVANKNDLVISAVRSVNPIKQFKSLNEKERLEKFVSEYPDVEEMFIESVNNNSYIAAFGYTEAELEYNEKERHFDRVKKSSTKANGLLNIMANAADVSTSGQKSDKYYFSLVTSITRRGTSNPYTYQAVSTGVWNTKSILGGAKYPAAGDDFIMQATPSSLSRNRDSISLTYNNGRTPKSGFDYSRCDGKDHYVKYSVAEDPAGSSQLTKVQLFATLLGRPINKSRMINSYYVHTWKSLDIKVEVDLSASTNQDKSILLKIMPSVKDGQWTVYSYVSFNF